MSSNLSINSALPAFDPTQTRLDGWITRKKRLGQEYEVVQIPFDKGLIETMGEPVTLLFTVSDTLKFQLTCVKEFLMTASAFFSPILKDDWFGKEPQKIDLDLRGHNVVYSKEHFKLLSDYINTGLLGERKWPLADLKALYAISNQLDIKEFRKTAETAILHILERDHHLWPECLYFGMSHTCSRIVEAALTVCIREYEKSGEHPPSKQYLLNNLSLIKKGASHLKNSAQVSMVEKAQQVFDQYMAKKNIAKFDKISRDFEWDCKYKSNLPPNLSKKLSSLKDIASLLKDNEEIQNKLNNLVQLFQECQARLLEPSRED